MKIRCNYVCILSFALLLLAGCSNKKNTYVSRQYHGVTTYFNVFFNGKDAFNQGVKKAEKTEPVGFDEILPVFSFQFETVPGLVASDMQKAIEKSKKAIENHSITAKPSKKQGMTKEEREFYNKKEFNVFVDDVYLLMGQSNVYLHSYDEAKRIFNFAILEYPKESSIHATKLWLAIVQIQTDEISTAENTLKLLEKDKKFPVKLNGTLYSAWADLKIKQGKYDEAISYLEKAFANTSYKPTKIRYNYILAQLNEKVGNKAQALVYYDKVLKMNPPYFTAFSAQMAKAFSYDALTQKEDIRKSLEKSLKDERNKEYLDQIYYALATVEKADNNSAKALEYYRKAISIVGASDRQKALSYNALADYYYDVPDYVKAYRYYDSASRNIGAEHSRYPEISAKVQKLKRLAENLEFIQQQDSLQRVAQLPVNERNKLIEQKIESVRAGERAQQEEQQQRSNQISQSDRSRNTNETVAQTSASGQWYFYNPTALNIGLTDFQMRWGRRKLEDNWRRRNRGIQVEQDVKESQQSFAQNFYTLSEAEKQKKGLTEKDKEYYLLDVPVGDEAMKESNERILTAMFNVAEAYRDDLNNYKMAIQAFEDINKRFPNSPLQPMTYIALYNLYTKLNNSEQAAHYKELMAQKYHDNPQVKATLDPSYVAQMQAQEKTMEAEYMLAVNQYTQGNRWQSLQMAESVIRRQPDNPLLPQYYLLRALSRDYAGDSVQYKTALSEVVNKFPQSDAATQAQNMLNTLGAKVISTDNNANAGGESAPQEPVSVNYSTVDGEYYFAVFVKSNGDSNLLKFKITARNADLYLNENYDITEEDMGSGDRLVLVGTFRNREAAMRYYQDALNDNATLFEGQTDGAYQVCIISDVNLYLLQTGKYFRGYYDFFRQNILK